jgi:hypothetical protein
MKSLKNSFLDCHGTALAMVGALVLTACGGGGGGTPSTSSTAPPSSVAVTGTPVTIPSSTYLAGSAELGGWTVLQQARAQCGFKPLTQNPILDQAAKLHAQYMTYIATRSVPEYLSHYEQSLSSAPNSTTVCNPSVETCNPDTGVSNPFYSGIYPWDRTSALGYGNQVGEIIEASVWPTSNLAAIPSAEVRGAESMRNLMNTVYHLTGAMYEGSDVGFGAAALPTASGTTETRFGSLNGFQSSTLSIGTNTVATYPCDKVINVPSTFVPAQESPNPCIGPTGTQLACAGQPMGPPIYLKVDYPQVLSLSSSSLTLASGGNPVPTTLFNSVNDLHSEVGRNEVFVVPSEPLAPGTSYRFSVNGTIGQTNVRGTVTSTSPFTQSFTFTTGS